MVLRRSNLLGGLGYALSGKSLNVKSLRQRLGPIDISVYVWYILHGYYFISYINNSRSPDRAVT